MFCKNRDRLLDGDIAAKFFAGVLNLPQVGKLLSSEHFSVDGTLLEAWASMKSFVPKSADKPPAGKGDGGGRNAERDFHGEKRRNDTHSSTTDPDARLFCKGAGKEAIGLIRRSDDGAEHGRCTCRQVRYQAVTTAYIFLGAMPRWRNEISLESSATNTQLTENGLQC